MPRLGYAIYCAVLAHGSHTNTITQSDAFDGEGAKKVGHNAGSNEMSLGCGDHLK
jgi:hypothetical protein